MSRRRRYTAQQIIAAAKRTGGNKSEAARILGCSRKTIQRYYNRFTTIRDAFDDERETTLDWAEAGLREAVIDGKPWAIRFALTFQGRNRGYAEGRNLEFGGEIIQRIYVSGVSLKDDL